MEPLKITKIHIEGLWGIYTVDLNLEEDVNILTGNNGAGKTTILDIIYSLLLEKPENSIVKDKYDNAVLSFTNNSKVTINTLKNGKISVKYTLNNKTVNFEEFNKYISCLAVSSIDATLPANDIISKAKENNPNIRSELDFTLNRWIAQYYQHMNGIFIKVKNQIAENLFDKDNLQSLYKHSSLMESLCNDFFKDTKKWNVSENGKIGFILNDTKQTIIPEELSTGEKQMIILLISTMMLKGNPGIVFWDEPELSLHIAWQQQLIRKLRELNPNMQLLIATHSPNILYEGWENKVVNIRKHFTNESTIH